ncbi:transposase [Streptomyces rochei]
MGSKYTKRYTEEFKRDAIALVDSSGKTVTAVARELGISSESLRGWYRRAKVDRGEGKSGELTSAEREELKRLRKEVREQQQTIEILKKRPPVVPGRPPTTRSPMRSPWCTSLPGTPTVSRASTPNCAAWADG